MLLICWHPSLPLLPTSRFSPLFYSVTLHSLNRTLDTENQLGLWILLSGIVTESLEAAGHWQLGVPWVMWPIDPYLGSVTLLSNNWLMVYGDFESRSHQFPRVWRLPHYLRPFTTALRKFYSQIRLNKVFSKKIIFGVWSSGSRRLDGHLLHWKGIREASDDDRAGTPFRLPPSVLQGWVFTRSNVTKTVTQVTSCPQTLFWGEVGLG